MLKYTEALFVDHTNNTQMGPDGLKDFMTRVGILSSSPDPHAGHDHSSHGHDDDEYVYLDYNYDYDLTEPDLINSTMVCRHGYSRLCVVLVIGTSALGLTG